MECRSPASAVILTAAIIIWMSDMAQSYNISCLIVFGDSTVDVGNNNYMHTIFKANFLPYGRDHNAGAPTGRFSNGLLAVDFLASKLGLPYPPAFLSPEAEGRQIIHGISFASAGSGFLDSTSAALHAVSFSQQMQWHEGYIKNLELEIGPMLAQSTIANALYLISTGANDYILNYYMDPFSKTPRDLHTFQDHLTSAVVANIEGLYTKGARNIAVVSFPPIGCLPWMRIIYQSRNECVAIQNEEAKESNENLKLALSSLRFNRPGLKVAYLDIYDFLLQIVLNPTNYGFESSADGCCGKGLPSASVLCQALEGFSCLDATKYVFWDSFHPTQTTYRMMAEVLHQQILQGMMNTTNTTRLPNPQSRNNNMTNLQFRLNINALIIVASIVVSSIIFT